MKTNEFLKWLKRQGCEIVANRGKGGHVMVKRGALFSYVPTHGNRKELATGTVNRIKKDLRLK